MKISPKVEEIVIDNEFVGFLLSADFTAEHEWGVDGILRSFNIDRTTIKDQVNDNVENIELGFKRNKDSQSLKILEGKKKGFYLFTNPNYTDYDIDFLERVSFEEGAWDGDDFSIYAENKENLEKILEAEKENDISITLVGTDNPFGGGGLAILINSKIPKEEKEKRIKSEQDYIDLLVKVKKTGIEKLLKDNDKGYFALSPRLDEEGNLKFWLNPKEQRKNEAGWYTIEDLKLWVENKGPIPREVEE